MTQENHLSCKRCGKLVDCDTPLTEIGHATDTLSTATIRFLKKTTWGRLCSQCLEEIDQLISGLEGKNFPKPNEMVEGVHYYLENGLWVFTAQYHMLRGSCCKSGCRHCPYGFKK